MINRQDVIDAIECAAFIGIMYAAMVVICV